MFIILASIVIGVMAVATIFIIKSEWHLKLHYVYACFAYFIQNINPWRMVFQFYSPGYWVIKDLSLLFFNIVAPP